MSSPPIIINSNPHLDFSQLNNSLLLHTANSSCQTLLSSSPSKLTHQYQTVIRDESTPQQKSFKENNNRNSPLISHYLPTASSSSPKRITPQRPPFVEYTVGHLQVFNQQPRPCSLTPKTPIATPRFDICNENSSAQANSDTKRHTIGCFGNSSTINALFNIICKENGINGSTVVSVEENMNNAGSRSKQQQPKNGGSNETTIQKRQENGTSEKSPSTSSIKVKPVPIRKGAQETPQDFIR